MKIYPFVREKYSIIKMYLKCARFDHWVKQIFIFPGIIFALLLIDSSVINTRSIIFGFFATCLIASANYIINEWLDAKFDKYHPTKKNRPVVSLKLKSGYIIFEYIIFSIFGLFLAWIVNGFVFIFVLALFIMGIIYNVQPLRSKDIQYIDVLSESINNALRFLIGWFTVTSVYWPPVSIVFGYWMGGAFLMATKRFAEYRMIANKEQAGLYRKSFKYYSEKTLLISAFLYALLSVFFCGIFMIKYRIELLIAVPFLCGLFCIYLNICYKFDSSAQKPEKLFKEKGLMAYILFFIVLLLILLFVPLPFLQYFLETSFITS
ncbi:prenyltransferase, UbiA family [Treponema primitia ZAS-2]|uniref:Prenyltransferase, UbiA family n=1 Tax=Treponema primitia (strain ATCC BAA-887 / DSM 12427 / ZAS-2) TaxID=545694 RepID=F5YNY5_TREPZ|nr:UbiA prenyltransferase family protein [Treponema primitia]AEF86766.1 prenyltransferase, UbiA family [Treponema primitia ZAS-2]